MAPRRSTALIQAVSGDMGYQRAMANGRLKYYTGSRPASADDAPTGTLLGTFTLAGAAYTAEVRATAVLAFTLDAGTPAVSVLTVGGLSLIAATVTSDGTIADLCSDLETAVNALTWLHGFTADSDATTVTISAPVGLGARANGLAVVCTAAEVTVAINAGDADTMGVAGGNCTVGVTAANGLNFQYPPVAGVLTKETTAWQMTAVASGTVGYARWEFEGADNQSTGTTFRRQDLTVGTSGTDLVVGTTTITSGQTYTIDTGTFTLPLA